MKTRAGSYMILACYLLLCSCTATLGRIDVTDIPITIPGVDCTLTLDVRVFQGGQQVAQADVSAPGDNANNFDDTNVNYDAPMRLTITVTDLEGCNEQLQEGLVITWPRGGGEDRLPPAGANGQHTLEFDEFDLLVMPGSAQAQ